jgi:hypothetical protein
MQKKISYFIQVSRYERIEEVFEVVFPRNSPNSGWFLSIYVPVQSPTRVHVGIHAHLFPVKTVKVVVLSYR